MENCAPSATEVLRIINETLDAFFQLPIQMHAMLLPDLLIELDKSLQRYTLKVKSGCGKYQIGLVTGCFIRRILIYGLLLSV